MKIMFFYLCHKKYIKIGIQIIVDTCDNYDETYNNNKIEITVINEKKSH